MKRLMALGALLLAGPLLGLEEPKKLVDYDIQVTLEPKEKLFTGRETLRWTNSSGDHVPDLKFHLYWNAFRNNRSTFFKESGGQLRGDEADTKAGWGYMDVTSMSWDGQDLSKGFRFESPDDGNPDDRTVLSVALPRPVKPGETVELQIAWKAKAPKVFARSGFVRDFFFVGQWFPKIGVYEVAGQRRAAKSGWNCHQYHANSEFYADWGDYKVAITVPENFVVASAGAKVAETKSGGKKTLTFVQKSIHDFAWTTDPRYVVKEATFDPAKDLPEAEVVRASKLLGRTVTELRKGFHPVKLRYYMQPDHVGQWVRYDDAQKWALVWFGLFAFPYPYDQISIIDPPEDGAGAGGMEYQTLYTVGTNKWLGRWPFDKIRGPEMVTIHEFGHGYWMGLVASNEFEESWMDEGINSFTEAEMCDRHYPFFVEFPFGVGFRDEHMQRTIAAGVDFDPIIRSSWRYSSGNSYGRNSYPRPATVINQIRRILGEETFWKRFRDYSERWRFDHPTSEDFFDAITPGPRPEAESGSASAPRTSAAGGGLASLSITPDEIHKPAPARPEPDESHQTIRALIGQSFYGTGFIDYRILSAVSEKHDEYTGFDDKKKAVNFSEDPKAKKDKKKEDKKKEDKKGPFDTRVVVVRDGEISLPVDIVLTFENGKTHKTTWDGKSKWLRLKTVYASKLTRVQVDPELRVVLDHDPFNNARYLKGWKGPSAAKKVKTYSFHLVEIVLSSLWSLF